MARGAIAKGEVMQKILSSFDGAFTYNDGKEIRVPVIENGELVQIKVTLTCAKENVESGTDTVMPGSFPTPASAKVTPERTEPIAPTSDEKAAVAQMLKSLGL